MNPVILSYTETWTLHLSLNSFISLSMVWESDLCPSFRKHQTCIKNSTYHIEA